MGKVCSEHGREEEYKEVIGGKARRKEINGKTYT
jgi:hypothetical protein